MALQKISVLGIVNIVLLVILLAIIGNQLYLWLKGRKVAKIVENDEFKKGMHRAQLIDLREKDNFNAGHIMGARNIPFGQFRVMKDSIRKDMPVYLYDQGKSLSTRVAIKLHKDGYQDIYILKSGFERWDGRVKKSK
ncbi:rhodanese-like domain protein [Liquorilactobacillus sucicola DSM 21376 = JCM 15457]|uniref:Rhodanese domain-containing protein n=1 Tax=Liquorilactobacillus sucicola DSM 21376 = JCM 15457 TaxID=1423806 RepID=A0A023CTX9_9LACO|nr:rhodanese-like domain-containing protein [Liquorilactobacillus sucicola]KRN05206.1 hypothetical protein FD15_GL001751 [Liquorilactobacillus sucicola DSM 21376 = JCM 15457]GAJ25263.1 rhodanese-like domain protein [Liquorilactobacillus sucicola DSM 21376 = JCM 15457]